MLVTRLHEHIGSCGGRCCDGGSDSEVPFSQLYVCFVSLEVVESSLLAMLARFRVLNMMWVHRCKMPCVGCALA